LSIRSACTLLQSPAAACVFAAFVSDVHVVRGVPMLPDLSALQNKPTRPRIVHVSLQHLSLMCMLSLRTYDTSCRGVSMLPDLSAPQSKPTRRRMVLKEVWNHGCRHNEQSNCVCICLYDAALCAELQLQ